MADNLMNPQSSCKIYLIGAGPGDPELLTLKAVKAIQESDAILYDQLVNPEILKHAKPEAKLVFVGKSKGRHIIPQEEINKLIAELAETHAIVSRLKGGDPFIFGRGGEEIEFLLQRGYCVQVIPGITAASGAAASIGLPLTHRDYASEVSFITGHKKMDGDYSGFDSLDLKNRTVVIYMGVSALPEMMREICKNPENCDIPFVIVEKASTKDERVIRGRLKDLIEISQKEQLNPPALLIIGNIVNYLDATAAIQKKIKAQKMEGAK